MDNIDKKYYASNFYDINLNRCKVKCGKSLRFWETKGWNNEIDPYGWFQWYLRYWKGRRSSDDRRQIGRWKKIVSRFNGILVKLIINGKNSKKIRQFLLHWGYELNNLKNIKKALLSKNLKNIASDLD